MKQNVSFNQFGFNNESKLYKVCKYNKLVECMLKIEEQTLKCYLRIPAGWRNALWSDSEYHETIVNLQEYNLNEYNKVRAAINKSKYVAKFNLISANAQVTFVAESFNDLYKWIKDIRKQQNSEWKCEKCTFLNIDGTRCAVCDNQKVENQTLVEKKEDKTEKELYLEIQTNSVYIQLINLGFKESISKQATMNYPMRFNAALKWSNMQINKDVHVYPHEHKCDDAKNLLRVPVEITGIRDCIDFEEFVITVNYANSTTITDIISKCIEYIEKQYYPKRYKLCQIKECFIESAISVIDNNYNDVCNKNITQYEREEIISKGLRVGIENRFVHTIINNKITCKYMQENQTDDPLFCPIYFSMKEHHQHNIDLLSHMNEFDYFTDEFNEKVKC
eukprot:417438_1